MQNLLHAASCISGCCCSSVPLSYSNFRCSFPFLWAASLLRTKSSDLAATLAVTIFSPLAADHPPPVDTATTRHLCCQIRHNHRGLRT
ncbi:hypothetical protein HDV63DRAFT_369548 [Trichoderma sp. SZMC 28014]